MSDGGQFRQWRALLPASPKQPAAGIEKRSSSTSRLNSVLAACNACRKRKTKCSGDRPVCRRCARLHTACQYATQEGETWTQALKRSHGQLRSRTTAHEELFNLLRDLPAAEAQHVLACIRLGDDVPAILSLIKTGDMLIQMAVEPESRFRYELPYRRDMPQVFVPGNPYLESHLYWSAQLYSERPTLVTASKAAASSSSSVELARVPYFKPFHAAAVADPLLADVNVSPWTSVCDDNRLMRNLLNHLFRCEYQFTAAFQKDWFLEDMAAQGHDFCSQLLVNVVLAYACVCNPELADRAEYWNPYTWQYRFLAEAKRLWELESDAPKLTTIQAGIIFNVFYNLCGLDEVGQPYRLQALTLAHQLRLFDPVSPSSVSSTQRMSHGRLYVAWALYNWETLVGFSFLFAPLLTRPPSIPLPDPTEHTGWYGEVWLKYPLAQGLSPSHFALVFRAKSDFRIIMNDYCQAAYANANGPGVALDIADGLRLRLEKWFDALPEPLTPRRIVLPTHLQLHLYYQHLLLTMYEPLLGAESHREPTPRQIVLESSKRLQTLIRLYYLRHGFEAMDLFIVIPLMLAASECIDAIEAETSPFDFGMDVLRSTLILAIKGLHGQCKNHYLANALFRVTRGRLPPREVALLESNLDWKDEQLDGAPNLVQEVRSHWPVSIAKNAEDIENHLLKNLVESYAHLNIVTRDEPRR